MVLKTEIKPDENQFLAEEGYYQVQKFGFIVSNSSEICPLNNCKYSVQNTQFRPNSVGEGYVFEGRLTVIAVEDGVEKSEFYYFNVGFDKKSEEERNGTTIQFLEATSGLGTFSFIPGIDYKIINATLLVDKKKPIIDNLWRKTPPRSILNFQLTASLPVTLTNFLTCLDTSYVSPQGLWYICRCLRFPKNVSERTYQIIHKEYHVI
jgi:hypothetical protein